MHARKRRKVLAEHLLFLLLPVIHYRTWKINKQGGGGGVYLAPKSIWKHSSIKLISRRSSRVVRSECVFREEPENELIVFSEVCDEVSSVLVRIS